jgi:hypothetical protein
MREMVKRQRGHAKLTAADAFVIRSSALSQQALADIFGVNQSTVSRIRSGARWGFLERK